MKTQETTGRNMIYILRNNRDYCNPLYMQKAVKDADIFEYGTCFSADVLDPKGMPPEDFLPAIKKQLEAQVGWSSIVCLKVLYADAEPVSCASHAVDRPALRVKVPPPSCSVCLELKA